MKPTTNRDQVNHPSPAARRLHHTRIRDSKTGAFVQVEFYPDQVFALRPGAETWEDITAEAHRVAGLISLGRPVSGDGPEHLAALVLRGIELILRRPNIDDADHVSLAGWNDIYVRFESNKVVETVMRETRKRLNRERKGTPKLPPGNYVVSTDAIGVTDAGIPFIKDTSKIRPDGAV